MFGSSKKSRTFASAIEKQTSNSKCPDGGIGRRAGLKHQWIHFHPGSTPGLGTRRREFLELSPFFSIKICFFVVLRNEYNAMIITNELINAAKTEKGGWTKAQLMVIGINWPPSKGWKETVLGLEISEEKARLFVELKNKKSN